MADRREKSGVVPGWAALGLAGLFALVCLLLSACGPRTPASPEIQAALPGCVSAEDSATAFDACSRIIEAGQGGSRFLAIAHLSRATHAVLLERYYHAIEDYSAVMRLMPDFAAAQERRALVYEMTGQFSRAIADLEALLARRPDNLQTANHLAWLLATCPAEAYRDGPRAVGLALQVIRVKPDFATLDTMAAAYAATGAFAKAAHEQRLAILALRTEPAVAREAYMAEFYDRLALYLAERPFAVTYDQIGHAPANTPAGGIDGDLEDLLARF